MRHKNLEDHSTEEVHRAIDHQLANGQAKVCPHCKHLAGKTALVCPYCSTPLPERSSPADNPIVVRPSVEERGGMRLAEWSSPSRRALEAVRKESNHAGSL